jgi:hypothetical protein
MHSWHRDGGDEPVSKLYDLQTLLLNGKGQHRLNITIEWQSQESLASVNAQEPKGTS